MALKNYMEDVVSDVLDILIRDRDITNVTPGLKRDIIAFSLNRLPPKYIVSERGFTHSIIEEQNNPSFKENIIKVINEGIDLILSRRRDYDNDKTIPEDLGPFYYDEAKYFNFPHFIGEICDQNTLEPIEGVEIKLFLNDEMCEQTELSWPNPYTTKNITQQFYSFWPKAIKLEKGDTQQAFTFKLRFDHDLYYPYEREIILLIDAEDRMYKYIRRNYTEEIDKTALEPRKK